MGNDVYANGMAIACKVGDNNVISAFPDVCLSPPSPPAGPIPIPYPLFSNSHDMTDGSKSVKVMGKEVMLRDKSYYKKCTGDEAATKSLGQGVVTHTLAGKVYFISWSMDVEIEGQNVVRHLDMTTSNHASPMADCATGIPGMDKMDPAVVEDCKATYEKYGLSRYDKNNCPKGSQSHHVMQNAHFVGGGVRVPNAGSYSRGSAPCVCLKGGSHKIGSPHYKCNIAQKDYAKKLKTPPTCRQVKNAGKRNLKKAGLTDKEADCIMEVVNAYTEEIGVPNSATLRIPGR